MSSYSNIYASLAQLSVKGQADAVLEDKQAGVLDIFSSAFYTHNSFACGFIRSEDQAEIREAGVANFQPPRSFDILHDAVLTVDLPGMIKVDENGAEVPLGDDLGYKKNVAMYLVDQVQLEIGGSVLDTLYGEYMHIHEELNGRVGKRLEAAGLGEVKDSTVRTRTHLPLAFWFQGGSLARALKLVSVQLHRIDFRVTFRKFTDLLKVQENSNVTTDYSDVFVRTEEHVSGSTTSRLKGAVRTGTKATTATATLIENAIGAFTMDFHGIFLNSETRSLYLNLQESTLFTTTQRVTHPAAARESQVTLDFKNAVYELIVAVNGGQGTWGLEHDTDPLSSLSFSLSSTPRTLPNLETQFFRKMTQFMGPNRTSSDERGIYYYPFTAKTELNNTDLVGSYVNASKIDDLRMRYTSGSNGVTVYARAYNLLSIKNGMLSRVFQ